jgi:CRISPR-associated protein Csh1
MIHQVAELGQFYQRREAAVDGLAQYAGDPSAKFRSKEILLLIFSSDGFMRVHVEEYDETKRLRCLYRAGPPNGWDATPTTGLPNIKKGHEATVDIEITKKLIRLGRSIADALEIADDLPAWEQDALDLIKRTLCSDSHSTPSVTDPRSMIISALRDAHPDMTSPAILTVGWLQDCRLHWVGNFSAFQQSLIRKGSESSSRAKGIDGDVKGIGQCCICGNRDTEVLGLLRIQQFKIYTLDKPGSVSGGFDTLNAWRNFPACRACCDKVDFSGERLKKYLTFKYYGFKYLLLPSPVRMASTEAYESLDRLVSARVSHKAAKRLTDAEDELFEIVAAESNRLQFDLLFYQPDPQSFRPAMYVSGLLPSRFRKLFEAQARTDEHQWLRPPSPKPFAERQFTFGCFRSIFPAAHGGSTFNDDFLAATRSALELRWHRPDRFLEIGMRWVQQDYLDGKHWIGRLADLFRSLLFFEILVPNEKGRQPPMVIDYGNTEQAERVRQFFLQAPETSRLHSDAAAQAVFLIGASCGRIETIQNQVRGSTPFEGKYKAFRLNQADIQRLFIAAKDKAKAYGPDKERIVSGLLSCAASALVATPQQWPLSPDEISYYFALGHALRPRLAKEQDDNSAADSTHKD